MKENKFGFTLIEIIVGISISIMIMIGVGAFTSSGIKNITFLKILLNQSKEEELLQKNLLDILNNNFEVISNFNTGIILKSNNFILGKPLIYDFLVKTSTGECQNDLDIKTKYLSLTNYNPFNTNPISSLLTGSYLKNEVYYNGTKIAGKGYFGDNFFAGIPQTELLLNNPGGLTSKLSTHIISDTGNNRIIYLNGGKSYSLLDENNGILKPTGVYYDSSSGSLIISNKLGTEILKLKSSPGTVKPIDIIFKSNTDFNFDKLILNIKDNFLISGTYNTGSFNFTGITKSIDDTVSNTTTGITYTFSGSKNISNGNDISINISSFNGNFDGIGNNYIDLNFYNGNTLVYNKLFFYETNSDNDIFTLTDNSFEVLTGSLNGNYTYISKNLAGDYLIYDYINKKRLNLTSGAITSIAPPIFEKNTTNYDLRIKDFKTSISSGVLNIKIDYYKVFDCFNEKDSIIKTMLIKKSIN
ncbi:hypothetical protein H3C61_00080 [Candidatus Gracilibacteria bacterium]|nr:hypothetical protein [Candidatus Gracilibacteria bacterium]